MNVTCASCNTQYEINTAKVPPGGGFIRCKNCGERIRIPEPSQAAKAIPLAGSDAGVASAAATPAPVLEPPAAGLPLPPAESSGFEVQTSTTEIPQELFGQSLPEPVPDPPKARPPEFLEDLPMAVDVKVDKPAKIEPNDLPASLPPPAERADRSVPAAPGRGVASPAQRVEILPGLTDPDPASVAPSKDRERKSAFASAHSQPSDLPAPDVEAPRLMDELAAAGSSEPGEPVSPPPAALSSPPATARGDKRRIAIVVGIAGGAVAVIVALVLLTPWFGLRVFEGAVDPDGVTPASKAPAKPLAKGKEKSDMTPAPVEPAKPPEPVKPKPVALSAANVDTLNYADLRTAVASLAGSASEEDLVQQGLLSWALFRLSVRFGDSEAAELLVERAASPQTIATLDTMGTSAALGAMVISGKAAAARKLGERLQKTRLKDSGRAAYVMSLTYTRKPEQAKALRQVERALRLTPDLVDARLRLGELQLTGPEAAAAAANLAQIAAAAQDPATTVRVARTLRDAGQLAALEAATAGIDDPAQAARVPAAERDSYHRLLVCKKLRGGDLAGATAVAEKWLAMSPTSPGAAIALARLNAATGHDPAPVLNAAIARAEDEVGKALLVATLVRLAVERNDLATARATLAATPLSGRDAVGWLKLAEGWIALAADGRGQARALFNVAARGRPKFLEARLALALAESDKPAPLMKKLSDLDRKGLVEASYHLGKLMHARGNSSGAAELLDRVLWTDPTVIDPVQLVVEWIEVLGHTGETARAEALAEALDHAHPADARPLRALIAAAQRGGRYDVAVKWYRVLVARQPDDAKLKVELAGALVDAKEQREGEALLEEMFKAKPAARNAEALVQLARAWRERDDFRAKDLLNEAIALQPKASTYLLLGDVESARGRTDDAKTAYAKALDLDPTLTAAQLRLARLHIEAGAYEEAARLLERVLAKKPDAMEAAEMLGDVLVEQGKVREGVRQYEAVLTSGGQRPALLMKIARLQLERLGQLGPSTQTLRRVIRVDPSLAEAHYFLGMALKDQGKVAEAREELQAYVRMSPNGEFAAEARRTVSDMENL